MTVHIWAEILGKGTFEDPFTADLPPGIGIEGTNSFITEQDDQSPKYHQIATTYLRVGIKDSDHQAVKDAGKEILHAQVPLYDKLVHNFFEYCRGFTLDAKAESYFNGVAMVIGENQDTKLDAKRTLVTGVQYGLSPEIAEAIKTAHDLP